MRWKLPTAGDTRVRKAFLLLPLAVGGERRWLEWAYILEEFTLLHFKEGNMSAWQPVQFVTEDYSGE